MTSWLNPGERRCDNESVSWINSGEDEGVRKLCKGGQGMR